MLRQTLAVVLIATIFTTMKFSPAIAQVGLPPFQSIESAREQLINEILIPGGVNDPRVLNAIRVTPRHEFVARHQQAEAYIDRALPIGSSQTISSPYIVAVMTQELKVEPEHKVLEIGTGSGYQAAVLSPLVKEVYSIEIVPELGNKAKQVLGTLGYKNVFTKVGDGFLGWPEHAPFDRIIVTCSPENVPQPLIDQLSPDGLIVIPVGERYQQMLYLMRKKDGKLEKEALRPTLFVPMTGEAEDNRKVQADPSNPRLVNGDFEEQPLDNGHIPGWYYQRGLTWGTDVNSPSGKHFVSFENEYKGRPTNLLQGIALDGRKVSTINLAASVKTQNVVAGLDPTELPAVTIRFFDEQRNLLETQWLGPFRGTRDWHRQERTIRVPVKSREAIISIGLFGATGTIRFDSISLSVAR
jgi:protein-L-isoaspartate(D-aspartate) O-methyltransferase